MANMANHRKESNHFVIKEDTNISKTEEVLRKEPKKYNRQKTIKEEKSEETVEDPTIKISGISILAITSIHNKSLMIFFTIFFRS